LDAYLDFLEKSGISDAPTITTELVAAYAESLTAVRGMAANSVARKVAAIRGLHDFWLREGVLNFDVAAVVKPPKTARRLPKAISLDKVIALLDAAGPDPFAADGNVNPIRLRNRALLETLYATGARISEVVNLDLDDLIDPTLMRLFGKGSKERVVPVGKYAREAIDRYLVQCRPALVANGKGTPALFLNQRGTRLSRQSAWQIIADAAELAQISVAVSPHTMRHSFATHLIEGGADVRVVQELLGHSSVATTQIYTLVTIDALREIYATSHPRARR
ncbi:MAG: site-specific tyrosine recombinase XerD, partial [Actinomycetes bacterium]